MSLASQACSRARAVRARAPDTCVCVCVCVCVCARVSQVGSISRIDDNGQLNYSNIL